MINVLAEGEPHGIVHHSVKDAIVHDDVPSTTIRELGIWEPPQTILACSAFAAAPAGTVFLDIGAHVGWFSLIAGSYGLETWAVDGDPRVLELLGRSWNANQLEVWLRTFCQVINHAWMAPRIKAENVIVKIDVEGSELYAVKAIEGMFDHQVISHCLMEVSPSFERYYPHLLWALFEKRYRGWAMPAKTEHPMTFRGTREFLDARCARLDTMQDYELEDYVSSQSQFDVILVREDELWG